MRQGPGLAEAAGPREPGRLRLLAGHAVRLPVSALLGQRGHLFPWTAVFFGAGIGLYFGLAAEPSRALLLWTIAIALMSVALVRPLGAACGPVAIGIALLCAGFALAALRAQAVAAPVLQFRYYGPVEGRITEVDRSASDALRLTLDRVVLANMAPERTPENVRISLQGRQDWLDPVPGTTVILTAHLAGPNGPVEPGDFDFRLHAWFNGLGAVGYTRNPVLVLEPPAPGAALWIARARVVMAQAVRDLVPGDSGGLAAAVMTGDRSGLSVAASDAMRDANLYHIVSISGMHMGMLVAFVFGLVRTGVALIPPLALRVSAKKVAAAVALPVAAFYLALAGRDMATERAFVMAAVMLGAVLLDRQALTMRSVAIAALIVLGLRPEALLNPGFQMSFAAVIALVFAFRLPRHLPRVEGRWRWAQPAILLLFSSLVAGLATAPFAAAHFNRVTHYGLIANMLAVPIMGILVMPGAVILAILGPLGLTEPARSLIDWGCRWVILVSERVAETGGAVSAVAAPPPAVLPLLVLGALFVVLWHGRGRFLGFAPVFAAFVLWVTAERPVLLISASGGIVGVMEDGRRLLSRGSGEAFVADNWLENDGQIMTQVEAARGFAGEGRRAEVLLGDLRIIAIRGARELEAIEGCGGADILVSTIAVAGERPCLVFDPVRLRITGAIAGHFGPEGLRLTAANTQGGDRLWTRSGP